jgi:glycosyltransferase involved in cell wall biosynthesis
MKLVGPHEVSQSRCRPQKEHLRVGKAINMSTPLVSAMVLTYQQVRFIERCLEGILSQATNFPIEIVGGDDGSVDGTREICTRYADQFRDRIRFFPRGRTLSQCPENGTPKWWFNFIGTLMACERKYIAWCDGDDYWTDPLKLQKQVDFLEGRPQYGAVFTDVDLYYEDKKILVRSADKTMGQGFHKAMSLCRSWKEETRTRASRLCSGHISLLNTRR